MRAKASWMETTMSIQTERKEDHPSSRKYCCPRNDWELDYRWNPLLQIERWRKLRVQRRRWDRGGGTFWMHPRESPSESLHSHFHHTPSPIVEWVQITSSIDHKHCAINKQFAFLSSNWHLGAAAPRLLQISYISKTSRFTESLLFGLQIRFIYSKNVWLWIYLKLVKVDK